MCDPVTIMAIAAVAGAGVSAYTGQQANKEQKKANQAMERNAAEQASKADMEMNARNAKRPNTQGMQTANAAAAAGGQASTMLTGPMGVDTNELKLGKTTLLGQ